MSIEAFIWRYDRGENVSTPLDDVLQIFRPYTDSFDAETGVLSVRFGGETDSCDIYLGAAAAGGGMINAITIASPVQDSRLWDCVLAILRFGNAILFFSDDSTPLYATPDAPSHFPPDLLDYLGEPTLVATAQDIIQSHEH